MKRAVMAYQYLCLLKVSSVHLRASVLKRYKEDKKKDDGICEAMDLLMQRQSVQNLLQFSDTLSQEALNSIYLQNQQT
jgi:hypothetical protein